MKCTRHCHVAPVSTVASAFLVGVTCGLSDQAFVAGVQGWGVCAND